MGGQKSGKHRGRQRDKGGGCRNGRGRAALFSDRSGEELAFSKKKKKKTSVHVCDAADWCVCVIV